MKSSKNWKDNLELERNILGKRIDLNWLKYKTFRKKTYLEKLNKYVEQLVKIDQELSKWYKPPKPRTKKR